MYGVRVIVAVKQSIVRTKLSKDIDSPLRLNGLSSSPDDIRDNRQKEALTIQELYRIVLCLLKI